MKALSKTLVLLLVSVLLTSCGGGGGGNSAFGPQQSPSIVATAVATSISQNSFTDINVVVSKGDGSAVADGTAVSAQLTPATIGTIAGASGSGTTATNTTVGGRTTFRFTSTNQNGTAHITLSVNSAFVATSSIDIGVNGAGSDPRLQLSATTTTLPINRSSGFPFIGSPYIAEVDVTWRRANGELIGGTRQVTVSINPVTVAAFSTLDNPSTSWTGATQDPVTAEGNEFLTLVGSGPVDVTGGHGTIFVHSAQTAGQATLTVTGVDPDNGQTVSATQVFTVSTGTPRLPASVNVTTVNPSLYVQGSGGNTSTPVNATITDGGSQFVPDPLTGNNAYNNVKFEIITQGNLGGTLLTSVNAQGQSVSGTTVLSHTVHGIASIAFHSGSLQGPIQIRATADRADNNVDNGIQDPVSGTTSVVVSDGRLFNLTITSPNSNAIIVNPVSSSTTTTASGTTIPLSPDGSYSLTVSVLATDRQGNPVLPGTAIRFGMIDAPLVGFPGSGGGAFAISGGDGDPQEGGTLFTAPSGHFITAGGGAGPGDTLVVFGKSVTGNRDLETARAIQTVNSDTSLNIVSRFNYNDDTGISVNYGPVLPYVIGRATEGNITAAGVTNSIGIARTTLNYPASRLGKTTVVWAESDGDIVNGSREIVTDAAFYRFSGIAPAHLTASPNPIRGNSTGNETVCLTDDLGTPIQGVTINFSFHDLGAGHGTVDGHATSGSVTNPTGADGCTVAVVNTVGIAGSSGSSGSGSSGTPGLTFSVGSTTANVDIVAGGSLVLQANPSAFFGGGGTVTLTLLDDSGNPVPGVAISGRCTSSGGAAVGLGSGPGVTNASGQTTAVITATNLSQYGASGSGTCTFAVPSGTPSVDVDLEGTDLCIAAAGFSPPLPQCSTSSSTPQTLTVLLQGASAGSAAVTVTSTPTGISCTKPIGAGPVGCANQFTQGSTVALIASIPVTWSGACASGGTGVAANVTMTTAQSCTATVSP